MIRKTLLAMLGATALVVPTVASGQTPTPPADRSSRESDIVVTATRSRSAIEQLPISVSVVDQETVNSQLRQNRNILSGLEFVVPGLSVQDSETRGSCSSAIRGRAASFQINGVPVNEDLRPGSCTGPFTISPFSVERVEVVRGGTALYGSGAPGGIINLITRRAKSETLEIDTTAQTSFNTANSDDTVVSALEVGFSSQRDVSVPWVGCHLSEDLTVDTR